MRSWVGRVKDPHQLVNIVCTKYPLITADRATSRGLVISSTYFPLPKIHKATWISPDQRTKNQIDHIAVDARHASNVLDVRTFRGANVDSDHFLVMAKIRSQISDASQTIEASAFLTQPTKYCPSFFVSV